MVIQNSLKKAKTFNVIESMAKEKMEFDLKMYEMALMDTYDSYQKIMEINKDNLFTKVKIL